MSQENVVTHLRGHIQSLIRGCDIGDSLPRMQSEYEMREFAEDHSRDFSSFAQQIGLVRNLDTHFSCGRRPGFWH